MRAENAELLEAIEMAPAAGSGVVREVAAELEKRKSVVVKIADALENALTAKRRTWDSGTKQWVEEDDTRSQLQAVFGMFSHFVGDPQKRVIHEHLVQKGVDPLGALQDSPALRDAARAVLEKAEFRTRNSRKREKPAERIEPSAPDQPAGDAGAGGF
jgi:hypothetical protein